MSRKNVWRQLLTLTLLSALSVAPLLWRRGTDIVTRTYKEAALRFEAGENPYAPPGDTSTDQYKYGPAFAVLYRPLAHLPDSAHAATWAVLNAFVFWAGVGAFFAVRKRMGWLAWVALAATAMELDISLRYQQANALLAGLTLLGFAAYREGRSARSGGILTAATSMKVLPIVFWGGFAWPARQRYLAGVVGTALALFLVPAVFRGIAGSWELHRTWLATLGADMGAEGLLDLRTTLQRLGSSPEFAAAVRTFIALVTMIAFAGYRLRRADKNFDYGLFWTLGFSALLLLSPRTESPTFVLLAPAYLFWADDLSRDRTRRWMQALFVALMFFLTLSYTDVWPKALWNPAKGGYVSKPFAALGFWLWALVRVAQDSRSSSNFATKKSVE